MIRNMESAAADDFARLLAASPASPARLVRPARPARPARMSRPERAIIVDQMREVMVELSFADLPTTQDDLLRRGFSPDEIAELGHTATRHARLQLECIAARRPRVPAGRAAQ